MDTKQGQKLSVQSWSKDCLVSFEETSIETWFFKRGFVGIKWMYFPLHTLILKHTNWHAWCLKSWLTHLSNSSICNSFTQLGSSLYAGIFVGALLNLTFSCCLLKLRFSDILRAQLDSKTWGEKCKCKNVKHENIINSYMPNNTAASSNYWAKHINECTLWVGYMFMVTALHYDLRKRLYRFIII